MASPWARGTLGEAHQFAVAEADSPRDDVSAVALSLLEGCALHKTLRWNHVAHMVEPEQRSSHSGAAHM